MSRSRKEGVSGMQDVKLERPLEQKLQDDLEYFEYEKDLALAMSNIEPLAVALDGIVRTRKYLA